MNKPKSKVEATQANFPVGPKGKNELKKLLFRSSDHPTTITTFQKTHSLHSFLAKAFGTTPIHDCPSMVGKNMKRTTRGMIVTREHEERDGIIPEPLELDSALTFLHHLGVSRYDVHKKVSDELRSQLDNEIERMDLSSDKHQEALRKLLVSTLPFASIPDISPIIITLIKKLGDKTPPAVLKSLAIKDSKSGDLKHGELLQQFNLPLKRLVWEADWISNVDSTSPTSGTLHSESILSDMVKVSVEEYTSDEMLCKAADLAFPGTFSERKFATQQRRAAGGMKRAVGNNTLTTGTLSALTSGMSSKSATNDEGSSMPTPDSDQDSKASSGMALSKLRNVMGKRPKILAAVLNMLIAEHGSSKSGEGTIMGGSSYLACTLAADIIISYGHLPRPYEHVHALASILDKCVRDGQVSDVSLAQIQSSLRVIFSPPKEKDTAAATNVKTTATASMTKETKSKVSSTPLPQKSKTVDKDEEEFERKLLRKVVTNAVKEMKASDPQSLFLNPVTDEIAAGYSRVIKKPMCIRVIESKASNLEYSTMSDYKSDVLLMYNNCITYNIGENGQWFRTEARRQQKVWKAEICKKAEAYLQTEMTKRKKALRKASTSSSVSAANAEVNEKKRKHEVLLAQKKHLSKVVGLPTEKNGNASLGSAKNAMNQADRPEITPLPESRNKRRKKDAEFPSMPALASMLLSDPFVARLLVDKVTRTMRNEITKERKIPVTHGIIPSVLQLLHLSQFSSQLCAIRGKRFGVPSAGLTMSTLDKSEEERDVLSQLPYFALRKFAPLLTKLLLDIDLDRRVSVDGDLYDIAPEVLSQRPAYDGNEFDDSSSCCILRATSQGAMVHLLQPESSTEHALLIQFPRLSAAITKISGDGMLHDKPFYMSLIQVLLRHKSKLPHTVRDMVASNWLDWCKLTSKDGYIASSVHECFLILLDEWASLGNTLLPRETRLSFAENLIKAIMETQPNEVTFAQIWNENESFSKIKIYYERMLQNVPEDRAAKFRIDVGIDSE